MRPPESAPTGWTRRQFLIRAGSVVGGAAALGIVGYAAAEFLGGATAPAATPSSSPRGVALAGSGASPSPAPTATPVGQGRQHFRSRPDLLPPEIMIDQAAIGTSPGYLFFTPANGDGTDGPAIIDERGNLVWLRPDYQKHAASFTVVTYQGRPALAWWEGDVNAGVGNGEFVLADDRYREIGRIRAANGRLADLHEIQITPRGTALIFADAIVSPAAGSSTPGSLQVLDCAVQEIDIATGDVVFEWHSVDQIDLAESYLPLPGAGGGVYDYVHANSIDVDSDGNLLISARNTSAIYKVDRSSGRIVWRLGGKRSDFRLGDGAAFSWQHDARRHADGSLSLYDDSAAPGASRGLILQLDEQAMTATTKAQYPHPRQLQSTSQGNLQVLDDGHVFVGWGSQPYMSEFAADGTLIFDASFPAATQSYRDFRFIWQSIPAELPAMAFDAADAGTVVYASWNGATEVAAWEVIGGERSDRLTRVATAQRTGFETTISVPGRPNYVAVRPLDRTGAVMGVSEVRPTA